MKENLFQNIIQKAPFGFAYCKIILDDNDEPSDFQFIEANAAIHKILGCKTDTIVGGSAQKLFPNSDSSNPHRINLYASIALKGGSEELAYYSQNLKKWYKVHVTSSERGFFSTIFVEDSLQSDEFEGDDDTEKIKTAKFFSSLSLKLAELTAGDDVIPILLTGIKQHTGSLIAVFNIHDFEQKALITRSIAADGAILNIGLRIAGDKVLNTVSPLSDEHLNRILQEKIGIGSTFTEVTFGAIPENIDKAIRSLTGLSTFYGIAHIFSGKLYGTTLLGFKANQQKPSKNLLETYAYLAALTLRRHFAEVALKGSEQKLKAIVETIPDLLFHFDKTGKFINFYQPNHTQKLIKRPEEFVQKNINDIFEKSLADRMMAAISLAIKEGAYELNYELFLHENKHFHARFAKLNDNEVLAIVSDITTMKKTELQLKKLNADKDRFMQILAHDLKNPLNNLQVSSELLLQNFKEYDDEKIFKFLNLIHQTTQTTSNLLEELLLWSKSQSGKLPFNPQKTILSDECEQVLSEMKAFASNKGIEITCMNTQCNIIADVNMLKTILRNLISNAIKFTNNGGKIVVSAIMDGNWVEISVSDNGVGISKENQQKLWDFANPFTSEGTAKERGTGLGLILCKEFTERHGGKIWVESEESKGSTFFVQIPQPS